MMIHDEKEATPSHRHIKRHAAFNTKSLSNQTEEEQNFYEEIERYILGVTSKLILVRVEYVVTYHRSLVRCVGVWASQ